MIRETDIIKNIKRSFPDYIGHDTAEINIPTNCTSIMTKDLLVENIHFRTRYVDPESLAHKALYTNLSDLVANGATPKFIMLGLSIPKDSGAYVYKFIDHFLTICKSEKISIIGGDTTASQSDLLVCITAIGYSKKNHRKTRCGAEKHNAICITGPIGESYLGFLSLENKISKLSEFRENFLFPKAKIKEGIWLGKHEAVTSMMDISDGLFIDLKRLAETSKMSARIELTKLPVSDKFLKACKFLKLDHFTTLLTGGEDYGLLFTIQNEHLKEISHQFLNIFGYQFHCIGEIENGNGVKITKNNNQINLKITPFSHFGEKL